VEFGLIQTPEGLKAYGAGMLSSAAETRFSIEDQSPNRIRFDLERVMRTGYRIDDFQETYFVLGSFAQLFEATQRDFTALYEKMRKLPPIAPDQVLPGDRVVSRGNGRWKREHHLSPAA
jgi:phenylalanine-4-hydroxylase